ncbi:MAG: transposase [Lachnospiraceae bacterium]|nr:transposase [Lachnospiraceae bacterium]
MKRQRAYRFRIYPDREQEKLIHKTFGCCRFVYNCMLSERKEIYEKTGKTVRLTPAKYKKEYVWLKEVDSLALANVQLNLETAYQKFFREEKAGFPKFKSKRRSRKSYTTNVVNGNIRLEKGRLRLPKVGFIKIRQHRPVPEEYILKSVTVSMEGSGKYYASLLYEYFVSESQTAGKIPEEMTILGIDFAMRGLAVFSNGEHAEYPMYYRKSQKKLAREQRKLSHCKRGSRGYEKQRKKVAKCCEKIRDQRRDYLHKLSREIADSYDAVSVEDIDMKAMSGSLNFGKSVMDDSFGMFRVMLRYKLEEQNKNLVKVGRFFPSSKMCSRCGNVKKELALSERIYQCGCGNCMDRDVNAAVNIREEGRRLMKGLRDAS